MVRFNFCPTLLLTLNPILDLADGGAHHFAETIRKIKQKYANIPPPSMHSDISALDLRRC